MRASSLSLIGLLGLFADEWPRSSPAMLRKGKPASFRLFPVGSDVVVYSVGSFLPTLVGLLKAICWCGCHHAFCAVSTPSTNALASDSLSAGGPLRLLGGFGVPIFACSDDQRFSTNSRRSSVAKGEPGILSSSYARNCRHCHWPCRRFNSRIRLSVPGNAGSPEMRSSHGVLVQHKGENAMKGPCLPWPWKGKTRQLPKGLRKTPLDRLSLPARWKFRFATWAKHPFRNRPDFGATTCSIFSGKFARPHHEYSILD